MPLDVDSLINGEAMVSDDFSPFTSGDAHGKSKFCRGNSGYRFKSLLSSSVIDAKDVPVAVTKVPRRPLSPYIFFSQEKRKELKRLHPEWSSGQVMK